MKSHSSYYVDDENLPFTYEDFCAHYKGVGLKEYIKSILVLENFSVKAQKNFLSSQMPSLKKITHCQDESLLYAEIICDRFFEFKISWYGAGESCWRSIQEEVGGYGILSFFEYLMGGVSKLDAFVFIDSYLNIVNMPLSEIRKKFFPNLSEIKHPFRYVSNLSHIKDWFFLMKEKEEIMDSGYLRRINYFEMQSKHRIYFDFSTLEPWRNVVSITRGKEVVSISRTLFYDSDSRRLYMSLFEDNSLPLYIYKKDENKKDQDVVIFEKYEWVDSFCQKLVKDFPYAVFTWLNPEKKFLESDWSYLNRREVIFVFQENSIESANLALRFYKLCADKKIKLKLVTYSYKRDKDDVSYSRLWHRERELSIEDLHMLCTNTVENDEGNAKIFNSFDIKSPSSLKIKNKKYLVEKLFRPGEIVLLVAKQKSGKSLFSLDLSMMLACGGVMGDRLKAPKAEQVLYVDAEMPEGEVKKRIDLLEKNYGQYDLIDQNLKLLLLKEERKRLNLLFESDHLRIESCLMGRKLLVLDNLGKMIPARGEVSEKQWGDFFLWLEKISRKGVAVLLVHHENKVGGHRGTGKITDDVDLVLSLKKVVGKEENSNAIELNIEDSRFLYGNDCDPFVLEYCEDKRSVYSGEVKGAKVGQVTEEELSIVEDYLVRNDFPSSELEDRQKIILVPLCSGKSLCVKSRDLSRYFRKEFKVGLRTVQSLLADLCKRRILVSEGSQKTKRYKLAKPVSS